ncbi:MAG: dUTP diphosphatase [Oscillospiraceae bacterium]|jgi:dUTP pyrophosphatase|nr:dUTP diphosphatase [Oscillospiraceae bacterium]
MTGIKIAIKKCREGAILPTFGSAYAAGADLSACLTETVTIAPHETKFIPTGLMLEIPEGYVGLVYARSGLASKRGLAPANKVGVIDADYRGEVFVALHNHGAVPQDIAPAERVAQLVITPFLRVDYEETAVLSDTVRGAGGFGSTGRGAI